MSSIKFPGKKSSAEADKDYDIFRLLTSRDEKALELVQTRYGKLIRYVVATILRHREQDIEECVNDVYLKIWNHGPKFNRDKASFQTYAKIIARNTALNYLRKISKTEAIEYQEGDDNVVEEYIDHSQNPEFKSIKREEIRILNQILAKMSKKDRELVLRRFYYLQSSKQIAAAMDMSVTAVDSKLSRVRKKIKESFEEEVADE